MSDRHYRQEQHVRPHIIQYADDVTRHLHEDGVFAMLDQESE
jgi:hypothetical protein